MVYLIFFCHLRAALYHTLSLTLLWRRKEMAPDFSKLSHYLLLWDRGCIVSIPNFTQIGFVLMAWLSYIPRVSEPVFWVWTDYFRPWKWIVTISKNFYFQMSTQKLSLSIIDKHNLLTVVIVRHLPIFYLSVMLSYKQANLRMVTTCQKFRFGTNFTENFFNENHRISKCRRPFIVLVAESR